MSTHLHTAGVDEAGRGPLAGPVSVAAVILDPDRPIPGLNDSKKLSPRVRQQLFTEIQARALAWKIVHIDVATIDQVNILQATMLGMQQAVAGLSTQPEMVLIDGNRCPPLEMPARAIIGGDTSEAAISAASILAKHSRDLIMCEQHLRWPNYGFNQHKGYPTPQHKAALLELGPCPIHRRSFAPVQAAIR